MTRNQRAPAAQGWSDQVKWKLTYLCSKEEGGGVRCWGVLEVSGGGQGVPHILLPVLQTRAVCAGLKVGWVTTQVRGHGFGVWAGVNSRRFQVKEKMNAFLRPLLSGCRDVIGSQVVKPRVLVLLFTFWRFSWISTGNLKGARGDWGTFYNIKNNSYWLLNLYICRSGQCVRCDCCSSDWRIRCCFGNSSVFLNIYNKMELKCLKLFKFNYILLLIF